MIETLVKAFVSLIDGIMSIFQLGSFAEKRISDNSRVGKSKMDEEVHQLHENILYSWWVISLLFLIFCGGAGFAIWKALSP